MDLNVEKESEDPNHGRRSLYPLLIQVLGCAPISPYMTWFSHVRYSVLSIPDEWMFSERVRGTGTS